MRQQVTDKEILIAARAMIKSGETAFICNAIDDLCGKGSWTQRQSLKAWINKMLGGFSTLGLWIAFYHPKIYPMMREGEFQEARLQWLDWMIENCSQANGPTAQ